MPGKFESSIWIAVQEKHIIKLDCPGNWISKLVFVVSVEVRSCLLTKHLLLHLSLRLGNRKMFEKKN